MLSEVRKAGRLLWLAGLVTAVIFSTGLACAANPKVRLETSLGNITLELYENEAPLTVANFLYYVNSGFYDGKDGNGATIFHRVINNFMIQGGGFTSGIYEGVGSSVKTTLAPIPNEATNGLTNNAYTIAMARTTDPNSATSQFFINVANNTGLNHTGTDTSAAWGYAVFGRVTEGQDVVNMIKATATTTSPVDPSSASLPVVPVTINNAVIEGMESLSESSDTIYFPHVASNGEWETEICVINTGGTEMKGLFRAFDNDSNPVSGVVALSLPSNGRKSVIVSKAFPNASNIGYITLDADSDRAYGYTKFYREGRDRVAVPAVRTINDGDIYIPHIASNDQWWTGISLLNTTGVDKAVTIEFNTGVTKNVTLEAGAHRAFMIRSLFGDESRDGLESAVIKNATGIIGLELFGSNETGSEKYLSGILLNNETASTLFYPHVASNDQWWTGIVTYNPSSEAAVLEIKPFSASGISLGTQKVTVQPNSKYIGLVSQLNLPEATEWFEVEAQTEEGAAAFVSGFELFGTTNGQQLGGYNTVNIDTESGILPKVEKDGWTGIALVNTEYSRTQVLLVAYDDDGNTVSAKIITLESRQKLVNFVQNIFPDDISEATCIQFISVDNTSRIAAFQLNGSSDDMMLDALPGLSTN